MKKLVITSLLALNFICLYSQDYTAEFRQDTASVEQKVREMLQKDVTSLGMIEASKTLEIEYDKLLNKYYKLLYNKLDENGQKALKEAQLKWIKFRDADKELVRELFKNTYEIMGGGTVWGVVSADKKAQITRNRVFVLYNYLTFDELSALKFLMQ